MKALVWAACMSLSLLNAWIAYKWSKKRSCWILPRDLAVMAAAVTLFVCIAVIVFLDEMGWYFN